MSEILGVYFSYPFVRYAMVVGVLIALSSSLLGVSLPRRDLGNLLGIPLNRNRSGLLRPCRIPGGSLGLGRLPLNGLGVPRSGSWPFVPITERLVHIHRDAAQGLPVGRSSGRPPGHSRSCDCPDG